MNKKISFFLVLLFLLAWASLAFATETPEDFSQKIQKRYQDIHAMVANYQRHSRFVASGSQLNRDVRGEGRLIWQRPARLRLEQKTPKDELIVAGEKGVWWIRNAKKRADLYPTQQFTNGLRPILDALGGLNSLEQDFNLEKPNKIEEEQAGRVLVLTPKTRRVDMKRLTLWFDSDNLVLKGFRIISLVGDVTEYRFLDVEINPRLSLETFEYKPPEDFRVRDHRKN